MKQTLWLLLEWIIFVFVGGLLFFGITLLISKLWPGIESFYTSDDIFSKPYLGVWISYLPLLLVSLCTIYLVHVKIFRRDWSLLGFDIGGMVAQFIKGGIIALVILLAGFILLLLTHQLEILGINWNGRLFFGFMLFFLVQSAMEEVVGRSYLIPAIESRFNTPTALLVSSVVFSTVHGTNANVSYLGLVNIFLAGLLMGLLFIRYRKLWAPLGFHAAWNFFQGSFLGYEVSGIDVYSLVDMDETGVDFFSGGSFGFEGSILATIGMVTYSVLLWKKAGLGLAITSEDHSSKALDDHEKT